VDLRDGLVWPRQPFCDGDSLMSCALQKRKLSVKLSCLNYGMFALAGCSAGQIGWIAQEAQSPIMRRMVKLVLNFNF